MLEYPFKLTGEALLLAILLALYLIPPGFTVAWLTNVWNFRQKPTIEKLAYSVAFSQPISTMISVGLGHVAGQAAVQATFGLFLLLSATIAVRHLREKRTAAPMRRQAFGLSIVLIAACALCIAVSVPIMIHGHLDEGLLSNDWYIRIPLIFASVRDGVPPLNPLFTVAGQNPALRYYYFFYVLCALPLKLLHGGLGPMGVRAALIAGTLWACAAYFVVAWILLKHVVLREHGGSAHARRYMGAFAVTSLIAGLDLIPNLVALALGGRLFPTLFWWGEGLTPWPGTLPFVPHHYAGLAMGILGYTLLCQTDDEQRTHREWDVWGRATLAAVCFAAALGTSTFLAVAIMAAAAVLATDAIVFRRRRQAAAVAAALAGAVVLDWFYIVPTFLHPVRGTTSGGTHRLPLKIVLLHWHEAYGLTGDLLTRVFHVSQGHGLLAYTASLPMLVVLFAIQWGFFWMILMWQARHDFRRVRTIPNGPRAMWYLFGTCTVLATFISSAPLQHGLNDFGRYTGLVATFVLMLWACPWLISILSTWRTRQRAHRTWWLAVLLAVIGLAGTAWDVVVQRTYLPLVDAGLVQPRDPFFYGEGVGLRYAELEQAWRAIGTKTPPDAIVQANVDGPLQRPFLLYLNRRVAAGDIGCEAAFGGDEAACLSDNVLPLLALYRQPEEDRKYQVAFDTSPHAFDVTCHKLRLTALLASDYDLVWNDKDSWVWHKPALYAGTHVRVLSCPR